MIIFMVLVIFHMYVIMHKYFGKKMQKNEHINFYIQFNIFFHEFFLHILPILGAKNSKPNKY
jgi:hypothetical protein